MTQAADNEDVRSNLDRMNKQCKNMEGEMAESQERCAEMQTQISLMNNEKRRMEADIGMMHGEIDEANNRYQEAEERWEWV